MEKEFFKRVCCLALLWLSTLCLSVVHASTLIDGLYYDLDKSNHTATVTYETKGSNNYASLPADVVIPESVTYEGIAYSVTKIGDEAFSDCKVMESISIPGSVVQVGERRVTTSTTPDFLPFNGCSSLKKVRFEDSELPVSLGSHCCYSQHFYDKKKCFGLFESCPLESVYIGRNIEYSQDATYFFDKHPESYGYSAFYNQPKLKNVTISPLVTEITPYLLYESGMITQIDLPKVKVIGRSAFEGNSKLTTLNFGQDLEIVGDCAFQNCLSVTKLTFPDAIRVIGAQAFQNCSSITEVTVGKELKTIGASAFLNCKTFTALLLPDEFTTMGESAFHGCI